MSALIMLCFARNRNIFRKKAIPLISQKLEMHPIEYPKLYLEGILNGNVTPSGTKMMFDRRYLKAKLSDGNYSYLVIYPTLTKREQDQRAKRIYQEAVKEKQAYDQLAPYEQYRYHFADTFHKHHPEFDHMGMLIIIKDQDSVIQQLLDRKQTPSASDLDFQKHNVIIYACIQINNDLNYQWPDHENYLSVTNREYQKILKNLPGSTVNSISAVKLWTDMIPLTKLSELTVANNSSNNLSLNFCEPSQNISFIIESIIKYQNITNLDEFYDPAKNPITEFTNAYYYASLIPNLNKKSQTTVLSEPQFKQPKIKKLKPDFQQLLMQTVHDDTVNLIQNNHQYYQIDEDGVTKYTMGEQQWVSKIMANTAKMLLKTC